MNQLSTFITCLLCVIYIGISVCERRALNDYIRHYETLSYDNNDIHRRHRRSADGAGPLRFSIRAHGRKFRLHLEHNKDIFGPDHVLEYNGREDKLDTSFIYQGSLVDEPRSRVHGSIINGTFRGEIKLRDGTVYHVENADKYFTGPKSFHSVIYNTQDMDMDPYKHLRESEGHKPGSCGLDAVHEQMREYSNSFVHPKHSHSRTTFTGEDYKQLYKNKYSRQANSHHRAKRATAPACSFPGEKNTCTLFMRSDPVLMDWYTDSSGKFGYTEERAKKEIVHIFSTHVQAISDIYSTTKFQLGNGKVCYRGVGFRVHRSKIMTRQSERCSSSSPGKFCNKHLDVANFLNYNSQDNHDQYCLAYMFTRRDFAKGTLGLAWVAGVDGARGGICEKSEKHQGEATAKSLNTGVVTFVNYQKDVPPRVSFLTFAHEVGHNFGSPHDSGIHCAPFGTNDPAASKGNYIMFASATKGDNVNNNQFSDCSIDNMTRVIDYVVKNTKKDCFIKREAAFCGNGIVEKGEECDCGYDSNDCRARNDSCCYPKEGAKPCTRIPGKQCSPSEGPCCDINCNFINKVNQQDMVCAPATDCANTSVCSGTNATCPTPLHRPDNTTLCDDNTMTCRNGVCEQSMCAYIGWSQCFIKATDKDPNYRDRLCFMACQSTKTAPCISSNDKEQVKGHKAYADLINLVTRGDEAKAATLPPGSPCDDYRGYCDVFSKCRGVDAEGPLARLKNLIFSEETLNTIKNWIQVHWWAVLLIAIGLVIFMGLFIAVCAVHTPSSNPRKPPPRRFSLAGTLRRVRGQDPDYGGGGGGNQSRNATDSPQSHSRPKPSTAPHQDPPPPYYYPSRPVGAGPAPGARTNKPRSQGQQGYNMEMRKV